MQPCSCITYLTVTGWVLAGCGPWWRCAPPGTAGWRRPEIEPLAVLISPLHVNVFTSLLWLCCEAGAPLWPSIIFQCLNWESIERTTMDAFKDRLPQSVSIIPVWTDASRPSDIVMQTSLCWVFSNFKEGTQMSEVCLVLVKDVSFFLCIYIWTSGAERTSGPRTQRQWKIAALGVLHSRKMNLLMVWAMFLSFS